MVQSTLARWFDYRFIMHFFQGASLEHFTTEQLVLIDALAPYFRHLNSCDAETFFERLFDLWFIRWRLKLQDFGGNIGRLNNGMRRQMEVRNPRCLQAAIN